MGRITWTSCGQRIDDPQSVRDVREEERACMRRWIMQYTNPHAELASANPATLLGSAASA